MQSCNGKGARQEDKVKNILAHLTTCPFLVLRCLILSPNWAIFGPHTIFTFCYSWSTFRNHLAVCPRTHLLTLFVFAAARQVGCPQANTASGPHVCRMLSSGPSKDRCCAQASLPRESLLLKARTAACDDMRPCVRASIDVVQVCICVRPPSYTCASCRGSFPRS